jgi:hypothetical protein
MSDPPVRSSDAEVGTARALLRHAVATLAYRGGKAVRGAPDGFADYRAGPTSRTPVEILAHISDLLDWAVSLANGREAWRDSVPLGWDEEVARFLGALRAFDDCLASDAPLAPRIDSLFQGPIADALTHVGQLTMLRRLAGSPVRGENYFRAEIVAGRVGRDQAAARREFD